MAVQVAKAPACSCLKGITQVSPRSIQAEREAGALPPLRSSCQVLSRNIGDLKRQTQRHARVAPVCGAQARGFFAAGISGTVPTPWLVLLKPAPRWSGTTA